MKNSEILALEEFFGFTAESVIDKEVSSTQAAENSHQDGDNSIINIAKSTKANLTYDELLFSHMMLFMTTVRAIKELQQLKLDQAFGGGVNFNLN